MNSRTLKFFLLILLLPFFVYSVEIKEFYKLLPDIPEWEASESVGGRIDINNIYTLRVEREYKNKDKYLKVSIISGKETKALWKPFLLKVSYEHDNEWRKMEKIDNELLGVYYNKREKFGRLIFPIEKDKNIVGLFLVEFKNISTHKALSVLKKIDLKELKKLVLKDLEDLKISTEEQKKLKKK